VVGHLFKVNVHWGGALWVRVWVVQLGVGHLLLLLWGINVCGVGAALVKVVRVSGNCQIWLAISLSVRQCCQHPQEIEYEVRRTDPEEISVLE